MSQTTKHYKENRTSYKDSSLAIKIITSVLYTDMLQWQLLYATDTDEMITTIDINTGQFGIV